jgi:hypothetical protein
MSESAQESTEEKPEQDPQEEPQQDEEQVEKERQERLDPDNRPENSEVDNSDRDFDPVHGEFTDSGHDEKLGPFNDPEAEDGEAEA